MTISFWEGLQPYIFAPKLLKKFSWKLSDLFKKSLTWQETNFTFFPDKTNSFNSLLILCSLKFGWRSPKCRFLDKRNVSYEFFKRKNTTLHFWSSSALKNRLMSLNWFHLGGKKQWTIFSGEKIKLCIYTLISVEHFWLMFSKLFSTRWEGHLERIFFLRKSFF